MKAHSDKIKASKKALKAIVKFSVNKKVNSHHKKSENSAFSNKSENT